MPLNAKLSPPKNPIRSKYPLMLSFPLLLRTTLLCLCAVGLSGCSIYSQNPSVRTPGVIIDDNAIEGVVERQIRASDSGYKGSHIVVTAYNGLVLLSGQVATEALRSSASDVAQGLKRVRKVHNELTVGGPTSTMARANDGWITTKVKTRLIANKKALGRKIKVQTENGVVYLLGLVTREQADTAVAVAGNVYGVQKIVKVFEYI